MFKNVRSGNKLILEMIIIILIFSGITMIIVNKDIKRYVINQKLSSDLKLGITLLDIQYPGDWSIIDNKLYKGNIQINNNFEIVDKVKESTGSVATIFMLDKNNKYIKDEKDPYVRISTNVPRQLDSHQRAIGTSLAEPVKHIINQGKDYSGQAYILETSYLTQYTPLRNKDGGIIGIWFVGVSEEYINAEVFSIINKIILTIIISMTIIIALSIIFSREYSSNVKKIKNALIQTENAHLTSEEEAQRLKDLIQHFILHN